MKHIDLFSGIGGFALAADRMFGNIEHTFCEIDPFCQEVLKKHWPQSKIYGDIRTLANTESEQADTAEQEGLHTKSGIQDREYFLLTGGFPCQPFSQAGRRKGTDDDRHLWPEMFRVIREFRPTWVIAENVRGILTIEQGMVFEQVCLDLEGEGYEVQPLVIPAVSVNAPHRRDRIWFIAHAKSADDRGDTRELSQEDEQQAEERQKEQPTKLSSTSNGDAPDTRRIGQKVGQEQATGNEQYSWSTNWLEVATSLCRVDDGLPRRMDRNHRLKALGNAIVPQVAEEIMKAISDSSGLA